MRAGIGIEFGKRHLLLSGGVLRYLSPSDNLRSTERLANRLSFFPCVSELLQVETAGKEVSGARAQAAAAGREAEELRNKVGELEAEVKALSEKLEGVTAAAAAHDASEAEIRKSR